MVKTRSNCISISGSITENVLGVKFTPLPLAWLGLNVSPHLLEFQTILIMFSFNSELPVFASANRLIHQANAILLAFKTIPPDNQKKSWTHNFLLMSSPWCRLDQMIPVNLERSAESVVITPSVIIFPVRSLFSVVLSSDAIIAWFENHISPIICNISFPFYAVTNSF